MRVIVIMIAMILSGCTTYTSLESTTVPHDIMLYKDIQMCEMHTLKGKRYFIFSATKEEDICADFR